MVLVTTIAPLRVRASRAGVPSASGPASWRLDRPGDLLGQPPRRRQEDGARIHVVLGLRQQVGGDPLRGCRPVPRPRSRSAPRRSRSRSRARPAPWPAPRTRCPARRSCPRAARSPCRTPSPRSPGRRPAGTRGPRQPRWPQRGRTHPGAGSATIDFAHARGPCRHGGHQQRRGQRVASAGHVAAHALERHDALRDLHARSDLPSSTRAAPVPWRRP